MESRRYSARVFLKIFAEGLAQQRSLSPTRMAVPMLNTTD
jgi:hypothetical protein